MTVAATNDWLELYQQVGRMLAQARAIAGQSGGDQGRVRNVIEALEEADAGLTDLAGDDAFLEV